MHVYNLFSLQISPYMKSLISRVWETPRSLLLYMLHVYFNYKLEKMIKECTGMTDLSKACKNLLFRDNFIYRQTSCKWMLIFFPFYFWPFCGSSQIGKSHICPAVLFQCLYCMCLSGWCDISWHGSGWSVAVVVFIRWPWALLTAVHLLLWEC